MPRSDQATAYLSPKVMAEAHPQWRPAGAAAGASWGGFLEWPTIGVGLLFDSNPLQKHESPHADTGMRITPHFTAERDSGVHSTTVYGEAEARLYAATPTADDLEGRTGILHDWAVSRDFILRFQGDVARDRDRIDSREAVTGRSGQPFQTDAASLSTSAQKTFDRLFVSLSGNIVHSAFENGGNLRNTSGAPAVSDQSALTLRSRAGYWLGPAIYSFVEPAANWRILDAVDRHSNGTRIAGGLGLDGLGLLSGDAYAGIQHQTFDRMSDVSKPVFGGRLSWRLNPVWTVSAHVERDLAPADVGTAGDPLGTPTSTQSEALDLRFAPAARWWSEASLQYVSVDYLGSGRHDRLYAMDAAATYLCGHSLDLTADLRLTRVESTVALAAYTRALATLGAVYRY